MMILFILGMLLGAFIGFVLFIAFLRRVGKAIKDTVKKSTGNE